MLTLDDIFKDAVEYVNENLKNGIHPAVYVHSINPHSGQLSVVGFPYHGLEIEQQFVLDLINSCRTSGALVGFCLILVGCSTEVDCIVKKPHEQHTQAITITAYDRNGSKRVAGWKILMDGKKQVLGDPLDMHKAKLTYSWLDAVFANLN